MKLKLKTRFFLSHAAVASLVLLCGGLAFLVGARLALARQRDRAQGQQLQAFVLAAREAALERQSLGVSDFMSSLIAQNGLAFAALQEPSGFRLAQPVSSIAEAERALEEAPLGNFLRWPGSAGGTLYLRSATYLTPQGRGRVLLAWDAAAQARESDSELAVLLPVLGVAFIGALAVGALAGAVLARQLARPLAKLCEGTVAVRAGRLDHMVEESRSDEIGELARQFNRMTVELAEMDRLKRDFVNGVTHDLGTPLHAMRASLNYIQAGNAGPLTDAQCDYLLILANATELLKAFLENLLAVARIEAGKVEPYPQMIDPAAVLEEMLRLYEPQAHEKGLQLKMEPVTETIGLMADRLYFRQIVLNLLTNALKFTDSGSIIVSLRLEEGWLRLQVTDTGLGVDKKYQQLIFEKFFRVRQPEDGPERKGTGLGLAIARGLAVAHGGSLEVYSRLGLGSTFTLLLPGARRGV